MIKVTTPEAFTVILTVKPLPVPPVVATELAQSGTGYFKIVGTNGFVPPRGTELQRPSPSNSVLGMTRYNIVSKALEVFDGVGWSSPSGSAGAVSAQVAEDTAISFALSLG